MKLYDVPKNSYVIISDKNSPEDLEGPPGANDIKPGERIWFGHLDGMYSYCKDEKGRVVHLKGWVQVIPESEVLKTKIP